MNQAFFDKLDAIKENNDVSLSTDPDMVGAVLRDGLCEALRVYRFRDGSFMKPADQLSLSVRELLAIIDEAKIVPERDPLVPPTPDQWALISARQAINNYRNSR